MGSRNPWRERDEFSMPGNVLDGITHANFGRLVRGFLERRGIEFWAFPLSCFVTIASWRNQRLSLSTKTCIYQVLAFSVLFYAAETWTILTADMKILEAFHFRWQSKMLWMRWQDRVRNADIYLRTGLPAISDLIFCFLPRGQAASLYPGSLGLEAAGRPLSQQISQRRQEAPPCSSARERPGMPKARNA